MIAIPWWVTLLPKNLSLSTSVFAPLVPSCWQVWNKLLSSCNKVGEANRLATSCSNSLISSARNKLLTSWWQQTCSNLLQTACISLVGTTYSKSVTVINLVTGCNGKVITTCSQLVTTTGNKQCEHILISTWHTTTLLELVCRSITTYYS